MTNNENELLSLIMSLPPQKRDQLWDELVTQGIIREKDTEVRNRVHRLTEGSGLFPGREPRKDCVKKNKRHSFSQESEQEINLIERM